MKDVQKLILEAVETGGEITVEELREYVSRWYDSPVKPCNHSVGAYLGNLATAGKVLVINGRISLPNPRPSPIVAANPEETVTIAPFQRKRSGRLISIEHSPMEIEDVARMEIKANGYWMPILLSGDLRVCIGPDVPKWDPAQETYNGVSALRITTKAGKVEEMNINPQFPVTLAPRG